MCRVFPGVLAHFCKCLVVRGVELGGLLLPESLCERVWLRRRLCPPLNLSPHRTTGALTGRRQAFCSARHVFPGGCVRVFGLFAVGFWMCNQPSGALLELASAQRRSFLADWWDSVQMMLLSAGC